MGCDIGNTATKHDLLVAVCVCVCACAKAVVVLVVVVVVVVAVIAVAVVVAVARRIEHQGVSDRGLAREGATS